MDYKSPSTWGRDFSRGINIDDHRGWLSPWKVEVHLLGAATSVAELALESIELAIEMESESLSTIYAGLKLLTPWVSDSISQWLNLNPALCKVLSATEVAAP